MSNNKKASFFSLNYFVCFIASFLIHGSILKNYFTANNNFSIFIEETKILNIKLQTNSVVSEEKKILQNIKKPIPKNIITKKIQNKKLVENKIKKTDQVSSKSSAIKKIVPEFQNIILKFKDPIYPTMAQRRGITGSVIIELTINPMGKVEIAKVLKSSKYEILDQNALEAAKHWLFDKNLIDQSNNTIITKTITYELK